MIDLYPQESWNFVFGEADIKRKVGVFSFARYNPKFWDESLGPPLLQSFKPHPEVSICRQIRYTIGRKLRTAI